MTRINKDGIDRFLEYDIWLEGRVLFIGAQMALAASDDYSVDEISPFHTERLIKGLALLETKPEEPIKIYLNSPGGDLYQGLAIYDAIKRSPCFIEIIATGQCMSAASIILQAADKRILTKSCTVMIHDGQDAISGHPSDVKRWADFGQQINKLMYEAYAEKSKKPVSYWKKKCEKDYILTSEQALNEGLADEVI